MEIFYNSERPGYDEIVNYGPKWWTEYREMDANYRFAGWTLDLMAYYLELVVKNQFPYQADEETIAMFEKLLHIESDVELSLEERKRIVLVYYSGSGHLSRSVILNLATAYTGQMVEVYWKDRVLCIEFNNDAWVFASVGLLQKVIERRKPAHISFTFRYLVATVQNTNFLEIQNRHRLVATWWNGVGMLLDGSWPLNGTWVVGGLRIHPVRNRNRLDVKAAIKNEISVMVKKNYWCLSGDGALDGTRHLNAEISKEVL